MAQFGLDEYRKDYADTVGWPEFTQQVTDLYQGLSPAEREHAIVLAFNYGEAGALDDYVAEARPTADAEPTSDVLVLEADACGCFHRWRYRRPSR
jgi:hypothetical protein